MSGSLVGASGSLWVCGGGGRFGVLGSSGPEARRLAAREWRMGWSGGRVCAHIFAHLEEWGWRGVPRG